MSECQSNSWDCPGVNRQSLYQRRQQVIDLIELVREKYKKAMNFKLVSFVEVCSGQASKWQDGYVINVCMACYYYIIIIYIMDGDSID